MTRDISGRFRQTAFSDWLNRYSPSNRSLLTALAFIAAAATVGAIGWSGEVLLLPVACMFPALWAFAPTRIVAALVSMAYFLTASRGLPEGVSIFYATDMWVDLGFWILASVAFVAVHVALWASGHGWRKALRYAVAAILMSVPPFGVVGWASPITAAGVLFPGWGWAGLAAAAIGLFALTTRAWPVAATVLIIAFAWSAANWSPPEAPENWVGIDTRFDYAVAGRRAGFDQQLTTIALVQRAARKSHSIIVLPESALGIWTATSEHLWVKSIKDYDITVLGGAIVVDEAGYDNVMIKVTGNGAETAYRERMPVPISMWRPWTNGDARAHFFGNPTAVLQGTLIAPLICYEQLIVWPIIHSMLFEPDIIVATGNGWWTGGSGLIPTFGTLGSVLR